VELVSDGEVHAAFLNESRTRSHVRCRVQEIRGISLVFREIWDTTALHVLLSKVGKKVKVRGIPHLAKNERDMGHPTLCGREKDSPRYEMMFG
jgi:hypothetical protein